MNPYVEAVLAADARRIQSDVDHALKMVDHHQNELDRHREAATAGRDRLAAIKTHMEKESR